ncbi:MAG: HEAT repeat domain-containing protein [Myxococcales bacterium]|nr:HEAT repeat domain-containing protein [Myxococcales bacterium]MCB9709300.1 HEAT repeat domain-containing protein [Myxococcales bacterium]
MKPPELLDTIFSADRAADDAELTLLKTNASDLVQLFTAATSTALDLSDADDRRRQLRRLVDLSAQVPGPKMIDNLIRILNSDDAAARFHAGEALLDVGYERYAEVARGIERALDEKRRGPCMSELPFIIAEIGEPSSLMLISRFLKLEDPDVVAAAIEALVVVGNPDIEPVLQPLLNDPRSVTMHDEDEELTVSLGELAKDAIAVLCRDDASAP